jgi:hypothetical protein
VSFFSMLGRSGSDKTTALRMIAGFERTRTASPPSGTSPSRSWPCPAQSHGPTPLNRTAPPRSRARPRPAHAHDPAANGLLAFTLSFDEIIGTRFTASQTTPTLLIRILDHLFRPT